MSELRTRVADAIRPLLADEVYQSARIADAVIAALGLEEVYGGQQDEDIGFVTEWKPIEECQCGAGITHRDEHHRQSVCVRASGHSGAHDDGQGCVWTGGNQ